MTATGALLACGGSSGNTPTPDQSDSQQSAVNTSPDNLPNNPIDDNNNTQGGDTDNQLTEVLRLPAGGHLSNPEFQWPATENADSYRLVIEDHRGDQIAEQFTALQAGCLDTTDACKFTPCLLYTSDAADE